MTDNELIQRSRQAAEKAYCPYSNFPVGAAVIGGDNKLYAGCNVENASYGLGVCAERTAIFAAVSAGNKKIKTIAVSCLKGDKTNPGSLMCCGACLQVIAEFLEENGTISIDGAGNFTLQELLPSRFTLPRK